MGWSRARWLSLLLGLAAVVVVVLVASHFAEHRAFIRLLSKAEPAWLVAAGGLQLLTYFAQGELWREVAAAKGVRLRIAFTAKLSLAFLLLDQALPSAGVSGAVLLSEALVARGATEPTSMAVVILDRLAYYAAYVLGTGAALAGAWTFGPMGTPVIVVSAVLMVGACAIDALLLLLVLAPSSGVPRALGRIRWLRKALLPIQRADPKLVGRVPLLVTSTAWQLSILLLDALTLWVLIRALGATALLPAVLTSYMISSVVRALWILPGGLGGFEAASTTALSFLGVPVAAAVSATLMFRGLSYWLPMLPGLWLSRRMMGTPRS